MAYLRDRRLVTFACLNKKAGLAFKLRSLTMPPMYLDVMT